MLKKFLKASSWVLFSNISSKVISFLTLSILARFLDPKALGIYNALLSASNSINQISQLGLGIVLQRTGARFDVLGNKRVGARLGIITLIQILVNSLLAGLIFYFQDYFAKIILNDNEGIYLFKYISLIIVFQVLSQMPLLLIMGLGEFKKYALRMVACNIIILLITVLYIYVYPIKINAAIYGFIVALFLNTFLTWGILWTILKKYKIHLNLNRFLFETKDILQEGFFYYIGNNLIGAIAGIILIGIFSNHIGLEEYGYLRIGGSLLAILTIIPTAMQPVTITFLTSNKKKEEIELKSLQLRYLTTFTFISSALMILFIKPIILILFGQQYLAGIPIIIFLIMTQNMIMLSSLFCNFLVARGYTTFVGLASTIGALIYIILCLILIPKYNINGYFIAYSIGYGIGFILVAYKEFNLTNYLNHKVKFIKLFLIITFSGLMISPFMIINNLLVVLLGAVLFLTFFSITFIYFVMLKGEREKLFEIIVSGKRFLK